MLQSIWISDILAVRDYHLMVTDFTVVWILTMLGDQICCSNLNLSQVMYCQFSWQVIWLSLNVPKIECKFFPVAFSPLTYLLMICKLQILLIKVDCRQMAMFCGWYRAVMRTNCMRRFMVLLSMTRYPDEDESFWRYFVSLYTLQQYCQLWQATARNSFEG